MAWLYSAHVTGDTSPVLTGREEETENIKMKSTYYGRYPLLPALVYLCGFPCAIHAEQFRNTSGRVMSLFSVIIFPNSECTDIDGTKGNRKETIFGEKKGQNP